MRLVLRAALLASPHFFLRGLNKETRVWRENNSHED